jgi:Family of unknown function (DUF6763)
MSVKQPLGPSIENWYKTSEGNMFEVIAVDEQDDAIGIQYLDGSLDELDSDTWLGLDPKVIDPPREFMGDTYEGDEGGENYDEISDLDNIEGGWSNIVIEE